MKLLDTILSCTVHQHTSHQWDKYIAKVSGWYDWNPQRNCSESLKILS